MAVEHHPLRGILLMLAAVMCFALLDATAKHLSQTFPVPMLVWARYTLHFLLMMLVLAPTMRWRLVTTQRPRMQITRALMLVGTTGFCMAAFRHLPLAETTALLFITPLVVTLLAGPLLHEKIGPLHWAASLCGFAGALLVARPGGALNLTGVLFVLAAAACYSIYQIQTRMLSPTENTLTMLFYTALIGTLRMTLAAPIYWGGPLPNLLEGLMIASLGLYGGTGHYLLITAFRLAPASTLSPLLYAQLIWATLLGWLVFDHWPDGTTLTGMAIIAGSSVTLALMQRRATR
ncbi:MAG: DMT family transporter [Rhodocyclaceae bacterium]|nr:DMT family transporter [Rhodocyclaceae bacterium]